MTGLNKRRTLVAGGAGFLGANLCKNLLADGHQVICLDNFSTGTRQNLDALFDYPGFSICFQDVRDPIDVEVDEIYNLACSASPAQYQATPLDTLLTSTHGVANLLHFASENNIPLLQASTSEVYGNPMVHPQREDYFGNVNPIGPRACYDEGKRCAETACIDYHRIYGTKVKIARIFNTYGPCMQPNDGRVVSNFIVQALLNEPLTVYGDGSQTRSFCFVDDLIRGFRSLMNTPDHITGPINLGNPEEYTVLQLAEDIISLTCSASPIIFKPLPVDDPVKRMPNIELAKKTLGWTPRIRLYEGLLRTIEYFDHLLCKDSAFAQMYMQQTAQSALLKARGNNEYAYK